MSFPNSGNADWWATARRIQTVELPGTEQPTSDVGQAVASMDDETYAASRAALGIKTSNEFGVQENTSGFPDPFATLTPDQMADVGLGMRTHSNTGHESRPRGIPASELPSSIGGIRPRGTTPNTTDRTD